MFDPRPLCCSSLTTAVGGTTDTNFVDSAHPTVARIKAFGYLYKEHQKEIRATIQKRDEELESNLNYREKLWTERIYLVNQNLVKMYQAQGEFEQSLKSIGQGQSELIKQNIRMQEWYLFDRNGEGSTPKPEHSIPEFTPLNATYKFEAVNLKPSRS